MVSEFLFVLEEVLVNVRVQESACEDVVPDRELVERVAWLSLYPVRDLLEYLWYDLCLGLEGFEFGRRQKLLKLIDFLHLLH